MQANFDNENYSQRTKNENFIVYENVAAVLCCAL